MATYLSIVFLLILLVVHTSQKPAKENILQVNPCDGKHDHRLLVKIEGLIVTGCGQRTSLTHFIDGSKPGFHYSNPKKDELYLVLMFDADSQGCSTKLKYMIGNIDAEDLSEGYTSNGVVFANYNRPDEKDSDKKTHRYYVYLFEQGYPLAVADISLAFPTEERCTFDVTQFVKNTNLKLKAGTMFKVG